VIIRRQKRPIKNRASIFALAACQHKSKAKERKRLANGHKQTNPQAKPNKQRTRHACDSPSAQQHSKRTRAARYQRHNAGGPAKKSARIIRQEIASTEE